MQIEEKFEIKINTFEGPLDLLLSLIESEKMDITKISLAKVASDFLGYTEKLKKASAENLSDFLDIASKLILIKSKVLLPQLNFTEEEQQDIDELEKRLKEYQAFKEITKEIEKLATSEKRGFSRATKSAPEITLFDPPASIDKDVLFDLFKKALASMPDEPLIKTEDAKVEPSVSIEEKIEELDRCLATKKEILFSRFIKNAKTKTALIVSFLAILELLRLRKIDFAQTDNFQDISIIKKAEISLKNAI